MTKEQLKKENPMFAESIDSATDEQIRLATDSEYAKQNPNKFLNERWKPYGGSASEDMAYSIKKTLGPLGRGISNFAGKYRDSAIHGPGSNALLYGGAAGALGGLGLSLLQGSNSPVRDAIIGALLGAGATYGVNRSFNNVRDQMLYEKELSKSSSFSDIAYIQQKIMSEPDISPSDKRLFIQKVSTLPESHISQLSKLLKTAFGASVAAILSKFLGGGLLTTIGSSILGGILGYTSHSPYAVDAFGRKKLLNY